MFPERDWDWFHAEPKKAEVLRTVSLAAFDGSSLTDVTLRPASQRCLLPPVSEASIQAFRNDIRAWRFYTVSM